jgi:predicted nucleic acid-binding protein
MKIAYSIKQKAKIALLLFLVMACTILIRILEDESIKSINKSFTSMYNDRLIPATDLFVVAEKVSSKMLLMEDALYISRDFNLPVLSQQTARFNHAIDSLIKKYESTYLVGKERELLSELKTLLIFNKNLESRILNSSSAKDLANAKKLYQSKGKASSVKILRKLSNLITLQSKVGQDLVKDSGFLFSGSKIYSALQIALAIVIGILICGIVFTSNVADIRNEKYKMN